MIIGMAPMALGLGEGGEQNAPLGRAVIGGLIFATIATLMFVPVVFSVIHRHHGKGGGRHRRSGSGPCRLSLHAGAPPRVAPRAWRSPASSAAWCCSWSWRTGIWSRSSSEAQLKELAEREAIPTVGVVLPARSANKSSLDLPGRLEAYPRAPIYARVSGYLKSWNADIGAPVKAGQLLAEIEAPDLDQQLLQAKAALASAQAGEALALVTAQRWQTLGGTNTVAKQTVDEKTGDLTVKQALTKAAQANVDRLTGACRLQARGGAVRRHRDGAQHRRRRPDQRRLERRPRAVRHLRHQEAPGHGGRAAELRAGGEAQHQGRRSRCRNIPARSMPASSRPRRAPSTPRRARPACSSRSTTAPAS